MVGVSHDANPAGSGPKPASRDSPATLTTSYLIDHHSVITYSIFVLIEGIIID
jgi:hypothetical protein